MFSFITSYFINCLKKQNCLIVLQSSKILIMKLEPSLSLNPLLHVLHGGKIWWRIKYDKFTIDDACVKLNPVNICID